MFFKMKLSVFTFQMKGDVPRFYMKNSSTQREIFNFWPTLAD